ncbi:hypothetical protein LX81_04261 [Palleronia aestuarii]|uniref:Uncharacterized protein n=1 Tax=Palleronia aestuarii TaxID=568105 RepID=A0A2W7PLW5_9RHOB|nr:hypothetical protein LX81_04261 [Palleronia aestuarii]
MSIVPAVDPGEQIALRLVSGGVDSVVDTGPAMGGPRGGAEPQRNRTGHVPDDRQHRDPRHYQAASSKGGLHDRVSAAFGVVSRLKIYLLVDGEALSAIAPRTMPSGLPMRTEITPGQTSDYRGFDLVMADNLPTLRAFLRKGRALDSSRGSSVVVALHEQTDPAKLREQELAVLQRSAEAEWLPGDLVRSGDGLGATADRQARPAAAIIATPQFRHA